MRIAARAHMAVSEPASPTSATTTPVGLRPCLVAIASSLALERPAMAQRAHAHEPPDAAIPPSARATCSPVYPVAPKMMTSNSRFGGMECVSFVGVSVRPANLMRQARHAHPKPACKRGKGGGGFCKVVPDRSDEPRTEKVRGEDDAY